MNSQREATWTLKFTNTLTPYPQRDNELTGGVSFSISIGNYEWCTIQGITVRAAGKNPFWSSHTPHESITLDFRTQGIFSFLFLFLVSWLNGLLEVEVSSQKTPPGISSSSPRDHALPQGRPFQSSSNYYTERYDCVNYLY